MILRYSPQVAQWMVDHMPFLTQEQKIDTYLALRARSQSPVVQSADTPDSGSGDDLGSNPSGGANG